MDASAVVLRWMIGTITVVMAFFYVWTRVQTGNYFKSHQIPVDHGESIIYSSFGQSSQQTRARLGDPYEIRDLRENEQLMYWDFDPVILEIHFHNDRALRMAYFTDNNELRQNLARRVISLYGEESEWEVFGPVNGKAGKRVHIGARRTMVEKSEALYVYGYILK